MWVCYLDGLAVEAFDTEIEAEIWAAIYSGDHSPLYEWHEDWEIEMLG